VEPLPQPSGRLAAQAPARHERRCRETTLLYKLVEQHYPAFLAALERDGRSLPTFVQQEFGAYLKCGRLEHGFLQVRCTQCHAEGLVAFSRKRRGFCSSCGARRMVETAALLVSMNERRWSGCAATSPARRLPPGGSPSPPRARCATR